MVEANTGAESSGLHIGIELGGTGCKIAIYRERSGEGDADQEELEQVFLFKNETSGSDPNVTCQSIIEAGMKAVADLTGSNTALPDSLGIASFGPVCLDKSSPAYGNITTTPKIAWQNFPVMRTFSEGFGFNTDERRDRVFFDTDVNVPAMFEYINA